MTSRRHRAIDLAICDCYLAVEERFYRRRDRHLSAIMSARLSAPRHTWLREHTSDVRSRARERERERGDQGVIIRLV